jgi:hypothetical protein
VAAAAAGAMLALASGSARATTYTWNNTSTDWNTITNWTQPAGGTQYAPGVSNPAINDVVIPNVGAQPNISATDITVFSLNISNGRTLTITSPRVLTIGGSPGGDLTLDGIISGGALNLGTGTHVINNAGGTGSLSSTNMATVLSGSTVTLNNNLQAGALGVNAGGSMNITNRTLSLNGTLGLVVPGGATFTTTGSTVVFNGTAVQQAAGIAYNNLTINNSSGITLSGNATANATLQTRIDRRVHAQSAGSDTSLAVDARKLVVHVTEEVRLPDVLVQTPGPQPEVGVADGSVVTGGCNRARREHRADRDASRWIRDARATRTRSAPVKRFSPSSARAPIERIASCAAHARRDRRRCGAFAAASTRHPRERRSSRSSLPPRRARARSRPG